MTLTDNHAFTLWCAGGRIGTYRTRERAEAKMRAIAMQPLEFLHVQEWEPGTHYDVVTFDDIEEEEE